MYRFLNTNHHMLIFRDLPTPYIMVGTVLGCWLVEMIAAHYLNKSGTSQMQEDLSRITLTENVITPFMNY